MRQAIEAKVLKSLREKNNYSIQRISKICGLNPVELQKAENAQTSLPEKKVLMQLLTQYGKVTLSDF